MEDWAKDFCVMQRKYKDDGAGGFFSEYEEGPGFTVVQRHDQTIQAQIAEKESNASTYTFFIDKNLNLEFHDVIKRLEDGKYFRVTITDGKHTPALSSFDLKSIVCEKWELTK